MQQQRRRNMTSVDEPNAFRITQPLQSFEFSSTNHRHAPIFSSNFSTPGSTFSRHAPEHSHPPQHTLEPASWLAASDLSSPTFSAHDFLQQVLLQRFDSTVQSNHAPVLENSFDADAALAALDTVESALRKKREMARREEEVARDELRKALNLSAKKRDELMRTAETVSSNLSTFADVGKQASQDLNSDVLPLQAATERRASLLDACDIVSLLKVESCELDAVRVSRLLSKSYRHIDDGSLADLLDPADMVVACEEIARCRHELAVSIDVWMKNALDSGQSDIVRECAQAAEALNISDTFIESYLSHILTLDKKPRRSVPLLGKRGLNLEEEVEQFKVVCWETTNVIGEVLPNLCEAFHSPARPLASVVRIISEKKVIQYAESLLTKLAEKVQASTKLASDGNATSDLGLVGLAANSHERFRGSLGSDQQESWKENVRQTSDERKQFLSIYSDIFKSMSKVKSELLAQCSNVPGAEGVEVEFCSGPDPYVKFSNKWLPEYLKQEKSWMEEEFGTAFSDVTRIETHASRLAPREASSADVYHRFRAFYGHIASQYHQMTRKAIEIAFESLLRAAAVLISTVGKQGAVERDGVDPADIEEERLVEDVSLDEIPAGFIREIFARTGHEEMGRGSFPRRRHQKPTDGAITDKQQSIIGSAKVLRDMLNGLMMSYLANAETILQAATHLLPVSMEMARKQDLWLSGAAPLAAYMQAVDTLSRSNETLAEFLLTLEIADEIQETSSPASSLENDLRILIPQETRELLHKELTSGLSDLGAEAQAGVRAAISSVQARLAAILVCPDTKGLYITNESAPVNGTSSSFSESDNKNLGLEMDPSPVFVSACTFVEQQLMAMSSSINGGNREFVVSELCRITRETVLASWGACDGPVTLNGSLQLTADGRAVSHVFHKFRDCSTTLECLPAIGQLFTENPDELWRCVESKALANIDAEILIAMLRKREDRNSECVIKVCQSLGATD